MGKFAEYRKLLIEDVHKKALEIIIPGVPYKDALVHCGLCTFSNRRAAVCAKFIQRVRDTGVLANLLPQRTTVSHGYNLCSGTITEDSVVVMTTILLHIDIPSKMFHVNEHMTSTLKLQKE